ncbi:PEP-CTERM sorting domain-containing protein [Pseudorhodoferax sp.]|uniref:PEP-CTERM sorting domain-containing protein n=1 Tax=Pseudorhodoferax sp. TaxID=1993553 RepID=UPI0039E55822
MKISFKSLLAGTALGLGLSASYAAPVTVGGVTWNPDAPTDFSGQTVNMRQFINAQTGELTGFGVLTAINGRTDFCAAANCEVTFQFSGFMPVGQSVVPGVGDTITYNGGSVRFYVGAAEITNAADYNSLTWANTGNGELWLDLANTANFLGSNVGGTLSGLGYLDVVGGLAATYFNTDSQTYQGVDHDFRFTASLSFPHQGGNSDVTDMSGTANLFGDSAAPVPEPGVLALMGVGMLGVGALRRRQSKK